MFTKELDCSLNFGCRRNVEDDFSLPSAFLQLARRQPELVGEGWEERGKEIRS